MSASVKTQNIIAIGFNLRVEYGVVYFWFWNPNNSYVRQASNTTKFFNFRWKAIYVNVNKMKSSSFKNVPLVITWEGRGFKLISPGSNSNNLKKESLFLYLNFVSTKNTKALWIGDVCNKLHAKVNFKTYNVTDWAVLQYHNILSNMSRDGNQAMKFGK